MQEMAKTGKDSFGLFQSDVCHSGHKAFQRTTISQKKKKKKPTAEDSGKLRVWSCDLGKTLGLAESLCNYLLIEVVRAA